MDINILYELALGALFDPWLSAFKSWSESHYLYSVQTKWRKPGNVSSYTSENKLRKLTCCTTWSLHGVQYFGLYFGIIEAFVPERKGLHLPKISSQSSQWGVVFYWKGLVLLHDLWLKRRKLLHIDCFLDSHKIY